MSRSYVERVGRSIHAPRIVVDQANDVIYLRYANRQQVILQLELVEQCGLQSAQWIKRYIHVRCEVMAHIADRVDALAERYVRDPRILATYYHGANGVTGKFV